MGIVCLRVNVEWASVEASWLARNLDGLLFFRREGCLGSFLALATGVVGQQLSGDFIINDEMTNDALAAAGYHRELDGVRIQAGRHLNWSCNNCDRLHVAVRD